jgi:hypothetical protein
LNGYLVFKQISKMPEEGVGLCAKCKIINTFMPGMGCQARKQALEMATHSEEKLDKSFYSNLQKFLFSVMHGPCTQKRDIAILVSSIHARNEDV